MNPENAEQQPPKEGEEPKVEFEVPDIKVDMKEQQIAFIKNLFDKRIYFLIELIVYKNISKKND